MKNLWVIAKFPIEKAIRGGIKEFHDIETSRKIIMINIISLIGIFNLVPLGINAFSKKNPLIGIFDLSVAASLIAIQVVLRKTGSHKIPSYFGIACAGFLYFYLYISGGVSGTGHLWLFTFPLFASFLLGARRGAVATFILSTISIGFPVVFGNFSFVASYSKPFTIRYSLALIVVFSFAYFFECVRDKTQGDLTKKNEELRTKIDELVQTEIALKDSEEIYRTLVDGANDGIVLVKNNRIEYVNPQLAELTGYTIKQVQNSEWIQYIYPTEQDKLSKIYKLRKNGESVPSRYETALKHKNGARIEVEVNVNVLTLKGQSAELVFVRDIREQKSSELILKQAKESAEKANRAKSDFLANMSHELRTPLNHIIGFTELVINLENGNLNDNQIEYLTDVVSSGNHLLDLINDILDLSKIEAGKIGIEPSQTDIGTLIKESLVMIQEKALKRGLNLSAHVHALPDYIKADRRRLKQIMYNLLSNAVKFTSHGGNICVRGDSISQAAIRDLCEKSIIEDIDPEIPKDREWIQISIQDSGIGIEKGCLSLIFKPFEQLEIEEEQTCQGTGLGLSLTKMLVELHGGRIWAESDGLGKGTTFQFILPVHLDIDLEKLSKDSSTMNKRIESLEYSNKVDI